MHVLTMVFGYAPLGSGRMSYMYVLFLSARVGSGYEPFEYPYFF